MDFITIEKANNLYWLGRYVERVFTCLKYYQLTCDKMIDQDIDCYKDFCKRLDIPDIYEDKVDFSKRYIFDEDNFDSIYSNLTRAFDNAIVLREEISGETVAYIDLSRHLLGSYKDEPIFIQILKVSDYINAFWGSVDDTVNELPRNIMKVGKYVEKLDCALRFDEDDEMIFKAETRMLNRVERVPILKELDLPETVILNRQELSELLYNINESFEYEV
ncbi:MAG: alpha-E domain-containing protein [Erysipelotrichaceae bacterium]|nr:alpha-E domain-containing protein [Erysipelotrichaceae bacterium]